jgi:homoserine dehydrogenase
LVKSQSVRLVLTGLGNVGRSFLRIMQSQRELLRDRYGLELILVGSADSSGAIVDANGLDAATLLAHKEKSGRVIDFAPAHKRAPLQRVEIDRLMQAVDADILLEATPVNLQHGQPGLNLCRAALSKGIHVVLANKGPIALAYQELAAMSDLHSSPRWGEPALSLSKGVGGGVRSKLKFSACVGGALPTINVGLRDLAGARIMKVEAAVNGTCQGILRRMEQDVSFDDALAEMQERGVVEADPSLDIDGWDAAVKLVIIANAVLRRPTTLSDLTVKGIRGLTPKELQYVLGWEERITLLGIAEWTGSDYQLSVEPVSLPLDHPISRMGDDEMGVVYHTDIAGRISVFAEERDAVPTAAAMLRDVIEIVAR